MLEIYQNQAEPSYKIGKKNPKFASRKSWDMKSTSNLANTLAKYCVVIISMGTHGCFFTVNPFMTKYTDIYMNLGLLHS